MIQSLIDTVLAPEFFVTAVGLSIDIEHSPGREQRWELFRGRLLDPAHTRQERTFDEWNVHLVESGVRSERPILSLKWDADERRLHVVRGFPCHVWEGYDSGGGVILSRETTRWVDELCSTFDPTDSDDPVGELRCRVFRAVVGAGRLPLTSIETPMPSFSLGKLGFFSGLGSTSEEAKRLEWMLHLVPADELAASMGTFSNRRILSTLTTMFNEVSLSPWTDLVERTLTFLSALERRGSATPDEVVDFLALLVLRIVRHLTAYDLVTFHHRGANYPDALLLDAVLKDYLRRIERVPELFHADDRAARRRRRALRQAWLQRTLHEGLPVPDAPTSPGENMRVLPPPHVRVPEEQILQTHRRRRILHRDDPLSLHVGPHGIQAIDLALDDLAIPEERLELGTALFLDRPLGVGKHPGEPDQTVLLSYVSYSPSIAARRISLLSERLRRPAGSTEPFDLVGIPLSAVRRSVRPGAVSPADAHQVAEDFVFLRTTSSTSADLRRQYDFSDVPEVQSARLLLSIEDGVLSIIDDNLRTTAELRPDLSRGYMSRRGEELIRAGLVLPDGRRAPATGE